MRDVYRLIYIRAIQILEKVVLEKLRGELLGDPDQYGGEKGCGADHLEICDKVLEALNNGDYLVWIL